MDVVLSQDCFGLDDPAAYFGAVGGDTAAHDENAAPPDGAAGPGARPPAQFVPDGTDGSASPDPHDGAADDARLDGVPVVQPPTARMADESPPLGGAKVQKRLYFPPATDEPPFHLAGATDPSQSPTRSRKQAPAADKNPADGAGDGPMDVRGTTTRPAHKLARAVVPIARKVAKEFPAAQCRRRRRPVLAVPDRTDFLQLPPDDFGGAVSASTARRAGRLGGIVEVPPRAAPQTRAWSGWPMDADDATGSGMEPWAGRAMAWPPMLPMPPMPYAAPFLLPPIAPPTADYAAVLQHYAQALSAIARHPATTSAQTAAAEPPVDRAAAPKEASASTVASTVAPAAPAPAQRVDASPAAAASSTPMVRGARVLRASCAAPTVADLPRTARAACIAVSGGCWRCHGDRAGRGGQGGGDECVAASGPRATFA